MRKFAFVCFSFIFLSLSSAQANEGTLFGSPMVKDSGAMVLDGQEVQLWGIEVLAGDQQCWRDNYNWSCGEQAASALKHYVSGQLVKCTVKDNLGSGKVSAQCFRQQGGVPEDIARYMVVQGWARDDDKASGGLYTHEQEDARKQRRGIWTSRFQTAADWHDGTQRFVSYTMEPKPEITPRTVNQTTVNNTNTNIYPYGPSKIIVAPPVTYVRTAPVSTPETPPQQVVNELPTKKFDNPEMQKAYDRLKVQVHNQEAAAQRQRGVPTPAQPQQLPTKQFDNPEMQKVNDRLEQQIQQQKNEQQ